MAKQKPPKGGREVKTSGFDFWNPKKDGDSILGTLSGTTEIANQRGEKRTRYALMIDKGVVKILPDHLNLSRALEDVVKVSGMLSRVYIEFLGKKKIENVDAPMAQYRVIDYGGEKE